MTTYNSIQTKNYKDLFHRRLQILDSLITNLLACLGPVVLPPLHIYIIYNYWRQYARRVDRKYCTCSCWDTVFKGTYESGIASYKHVYFNATRNSAKIWVLTVICVVSLYEALRRLTSLALCRQLRFSMLILFLSSVFSHYYSWWSFVNYWNDDFYPQWWHQMWFSLTELGSSVLVLRLADSRTTPRLTAVLPIVAVAALHVVAAAWDQFVENVLHAGGSTHQVLRDLGFMVPDALHIVFPLLELSFPRRSVLRTMCIIITLVSSLGFVYFVLQ